MNRLIPRLRIGTAMLFAAVMVMWLRLPDASQAVENLPDSAEVMRRMVARAQATAGAETGPQYVYDKRSRVEQLDSAGQTTKSEEKVYRVRLVAGFPFSRLVKVQGRELTGEELKKEEQKEERFRQKLTAVDARKLAARKEGWVTTNLLDRYQFTVAERVTLNGRRTLAVAFRPKEGKPVGRSFADKVLNHLSGTVWVDEEDADVAKLSVSLGETVSLGWFGVLGSLSRCDLSLERQRMADGVWVNAKQVLLIHCRKVAATQRFRATEESSGFERAERL